MDVGITEFIGMHPGFHGVIKQRYSDFHVNEIGQDGNVVRLTNLKLPEEKGAVSSDVPKLDEVLPKEIKEKLDELLESKEDDVEYDVSHLEKHERKEIHSSVKIHYEDQICSSTEDKQHKKVIVFQHSSKVKANMLSNTWPRERGGHVVQFVVYKENMDTMEAVSLLSHRLRIKTNKISYAGTKDRRAKTSQLMSVVRIDPQTLLNINNQFHGIMLGNFSYQRRVLRLGDLKGNRFRIVLRNVNESDEELDKGLKSLEELGFINYYGLQRFGTCKEVPTFQIGKALLLGNFKEAIELILKPRDASEPSDLKRARKLWWEKRDAKAALRCFYNYKRRIEGKLLYGLSKCAENDLVSALEMIPRNTRLLYLHSYQSFIWNKIVSRRIKEFGLDTLPGDLVMVDGEKEEFLDIDSTDFCEVDDSGEQSEGSSQSNWKRKERKHSGSEKDKNEIQDEEGNKKIEEEAETEALVGESEDKSLNLEIRIDEEKMRGGNEEIEVKNEEEFASETISIDNRYKRKLEVKFLTEDDVKNYSLTDVLIPLPGHDVVYPKNIVAEWYKELLTEDGLSSSSLKQTVKQYSVGGAYRHMVVKPRNLSWRTTKYDDPNVALILSDYEELQSTAPPVDVPSGKYKALLLDFCLPASSYATMALREIMKCDTSATHQASLNDYCKQVDDDKEKGKEGDEQNKRKAGELDENAELEKGSNVEKKTKLDDEDEDEMDIMLNLLTGYKEH